jgi:hypothetical protein
LAIVLGEICDLSESVCKNFAFLKITEKRIKYRKISSKQHERCQIPSQLQKQNPANSPFANPSVSQNGTTQNPLAVLTNNEHFVTFFVRNESNMMHLAGLVLRSRCSILFAQRRMEY